MAVPVQGDGPVAGPFGEQGAQPGRRGVAGRVGRAEQGDRLGRAAGQQGDGGQVVAVAQAAAGVEEGGDRFGRAVGQGEGGAQPGLPVGEGAGQGVGEGEGGGGAFALLGAVAAGDQQVGGLAQGGLAQRGAVAGGGGVFGGGALPEFAGGGGVCGQAGAGEPVAGQGPALAQVLVIQRLPAGEGAGRASVRARARPWWKAAIVVQRVPGSVSASARRTGSASAGCPAASRAAPSRMRAGRQSGAWPRPVR